MSLTTDFVRPLARNIVQLERQLSPEKIEWLSRGLGDDMVKKMVLEETKKTEEIKTLYDNPKTIVLDNKQYYIVESDVKLTPEQFKEYDARRKALIKAAEHLRTNPNALLGMVDPFGHLVRWGPEQAHRLTYWVDKQSFGQYEINGDSIARLMVVATINWENVCGVHFEEVPDKSQALFTVKFNTDNSEPGLMAAAFFPNDPPEQRVLYIFPGFARNGYDMTGILRHELGHILGYRHEHIRLVGGEPTVYRGATLFPVTAVDTHSVMHYYIRGVGGSKNGEISDLDVRGAQFYYGAPLYLFPGTPSAN